MTRICARSVLDSDYRALHVVVVDNGSSFPTLEPLAEEFPSIVPLQLEEKQGFTGGCNPGLEKVLELGAKYIFLLNKDTVVDRNAIGELYRGMEERQDVTMASALLVNPGEEKTVQSHTGSVYPDRAFLTRSGTEVPVTEEHRKDAETEFASACAIILRPKVLRDLGLFYKTFFTN